MRKCGGVADSGYLFSVSEAAAAQNPADALKLLDELITKGKDISRFIEELTLHYRNLMLTKSVGAAFVKGTDEELKRYSEQCKKLSSDEIMRQVDLISDSLDNINRMKQTGQGRLLTEQLLIRLCSPRLSNDSSSLAARLGALENRLNNLYASDLVKHTDNPERTSDISAASTSIPDKPETASAPYSVSPSEGTSGESDKNTNALDTLPLDIDGIPFPEPPPDIGYEYVPFIDAPSSSPIPVTVSVSDSGALTRPESSEYLKTEPPAHDKTDVNRAKEKSYTEEPENNTDAEKSAPKEKREEENVPASPKSAEKSESLPIPESDMELPADCKPLAQWEDITAQLPASSRNILKNVKAYLYGGKIYVESTPSSLSMMKSGRRAAKLRDAVHLVMGGKLDIFTLPEKVYKEDIKEDLITPFLDRAREMGIEVTVKDK